ncbi:hypothetical protein C8R44DRAFT_873390 [Mycena epipterygia]|nr:hypothetical protein C8R44DRAFT_873390 [Mycena epipterygia]
MEQAEAALQLTMSQGAPKLRKVGFILLNPNAFAFPWEQITWICLFNVQLPQHVAQLLRASINVDSFGVQILSSSDYEIMVNLADVPPLVHLERLTFIRVDGSKHDPRTQTQLLAKLTLPAQLFVPFRAHFEAGHRPRRAELTFMIWLRFVFPLY